MSPQKACNTCGRPNCQRHKGKRRATRDYSNTAAYRRMLPEVLETYGDLCHYCREPVELDAEETDAQLVLAHYPIAFADGGPFELDNLRPAHRGCNRRAGR